MEEYDVPKPQATRDVSNKESKPCRVETAQEKETHEVPSHKLHKKRSCASKEEYNGLNGEGPEDPKISKTKTLQPNNVGLQEEVPKSKKQHSEQHDSSVSMSPVKENKEKNGYDPFIYRNNGKKLIFKRTSYDYKLICPSCLKETKQMIQHIPKGNCKLTMNMDDFKSQLKDFKKSYTKENQKQRKKECIERQRALDEDKVKEKQNQNKRASRDAQRALDENKVKEKQNKDKRECIDRQRALDEDKVKEKQNQNKRASRDTQRALDENKVKEKQNKHSKLSLSKRKAEDHQKLKDQQNTRQQKCRRILNECDRFQKCNKV